PQERLKAVCTSQEEYYRYDDEFEELTQLDEYPHYHRSEHIGWICLGKISFSSRIQGLLDPAWRDPSTWAPNMTPTTATGAAVSGWHEADVIGSERKLRYNTADEVAEISKALDALDLEALVREHLVRHMRERDSDFVERLEHLRDFYRIAAERRQAVLTDQE
ncbi:MAG: DUF1877 family protein, partial [Bacteroidota bacterium]